MILVDYAQNRYLRLKNIDGTPHECSRVSAKLSTPSAHHTSASRLKVYEQCQFAFHRGTVLGEAPRDEGGAPAQAGKLLHAAGLEMCGLSRWRASLEGKSQRDRIDALGRSVEAPELTSALESPAVLAKEHWSPEALALAHSLVPAVAAALDFTFLIGDEHGPLLEREFSESVGANVVAGGVIDYVEQISGRDGEPDTIIVHDLKTGRTIEATAADGLYGLWARRRWPEADVKVVRHYAALGITVEITRERLDKAIEEATALARAVVIKSRSAKADEAMWLASPGPQCETCFHSAKCEPRKAAEARALEGSTDLPTTTAGLLAAIEQADERSTHANRVTRWASKLRKAAKAALADRIGADGTAVIGEYGVKLVASPREAYEVDDGVTQRLKVWRIDTPALAPPVRAEPASVAEAPKLAEGSVPVAVATSEPSGVSAGATESAGAVGAAGPEAPAREPTSSCTPSRQSPIDGSVAPSPRAALRHSDVRGPGVRDAETVRHVSASSTPARPCAAPVGPLEQQASLPASVQSADQNPDAIGAAPAPPQSGGAVAPLPPVSPGADPVVKRPRGRPRKAPEMKVLSETVGPPVTMRFLEAPRDLKALAEDLAAYLDGSSARLAEDGAVILDGPARQGEASLMMTVDLVNSMCKRWGRAYVEPRWLLAGGNTECEDGTGEFQACSGPTFVRFFERIKSKKGGEA